MVEDIRGSEKNRTRHCVLKKKGWIKVASVCILVIRSVSRFHHFFLLRFLPFSLSSLPLSFFPSPPFPPFPLPLPPFLSISCCQLWVDCFESGLKGLIFLSLDTFIWDLVFLVSFSITSSFQSGSFHIMLNNLGWRWNKESEFWLFTLLLRSSSFGGGGNKIAFEPSTMVNSLPALPLLIPLSSPLSPVLCNLHLAVIKPRIGGDEYCTRNPRVVSGTNSDWLSLCSYCMPCCGITGLLSKPRCSFCFQWKSGWIVNLGKQWNKHLLSIQ